MAMPGSCSVHTSERTSARERGVANKRAALRKIARQIASCRRCKRGSIGKAVVGEGSPDAEILFVGEAPGRHEAESGRPFVGQAGRWLCRAIRSIGLDENAVYLTSPVRARHGSVIDRDGRTYLITCHPAAAARVPAIRRAGQRDFRKLSRLVAQHPTHRA